MVYLKCFQLQVIRILVEMILIRYVVLPFLAILMCPISSNNHSFLEDLSSDNFSLGCFFFFHSALWTGWQMILRSKRVLTY
jgi:hypothetical protein